MELPDVILHPTRLRIVHALRRGTLTTTELVVRLPDVPTTTLYRHVALLLEHGVLEVVAETRRRGGTERTLRLNASRANIDPETAASLSLDDHRAGFAAAMSALLAEFSHYLDTEGADPTADSVGYRQGVIWLTADERRDLLEEIGRVVRRRAHTSPTSGRRPHMFSVIEFPVADGSAAEEDGSAAGEGGISRG